MADSKFKRVGVGWLTKDRKGIRGVINEDVPSGAKVYINRNKFKNNSQEDEKKPDYTISLIVEDEPTGF